MNAGNGAITPIREPAVRRNLAAWRTRRRAILAPRPLTASFAEVVQGKEDFKKDWFVTVKVLALHAEERVMTLSEEVFKRQQNLMIETGVNDFPIGKVIYFFLQ